MWWCHNQCTRPWGGEKFSNARIPWKPDRLYSLTEERNTSAWACHGYSHAKEATVGGPDAVGTRNQAYERLIRASGLDVTHLIGEKRDVQREAPPGE